METQLSETPYSSTFYANRDDGSLRSARAIGQLVLSRYPARSVVDVGCGNGCWLAAFQELGVKDILGLDGDYVDRAQLRIPKDKFRPTDLTQSVVLDRRFDLAVCMEVGEHLPESASEILVATLVSAADVILFSAAPPGQGGTHHINEQPPKYWAERFARRGYDCLDWIRPLVWEDAEIDWWYAQNAIIYASQEVIRKHPDLGNACLPQARGPMHLVHPRSFESKASQIEKLLDYRWIPGLRWSSGLWIRSFRQAIDVRLRRPAPSARSTMEISQ